MNMSLIKEADLVFQRATYKYKCIDDALEFVDGEEEPDFEEDLIFQI